MSDLPEPTLEQTARNAQEFLESVADLMVRFELQPLLTICLLGKFTQALAEREAEASGTDLPAVMMSAFQAFGKGMGMDTLVKHVKGDEAAQLRAEFERDESPTPLQ